MPVLNLSHLRWRKSSRSTANGECVELASLDVRVAVRDSKNPQQQSKVFGRAQWSTFARNLKSGQFDLG